MLAPSAAGVFMFGFRQLFGRGMSKETLKTLADHEIYEVETYVLPLYFVNVQVATKDILLQDTLKIYTLSNGLFLWGVLREFIRLRPRLPTKPDARVFVHMLKFVMNHEEMSLDQARDRVHQIADAAKGRNPIWKAILQHGEEAWRDRSDHHLKICYEITDALLKNLAASKQ